MKPKIVCYLLGFCTPLIVLIVIGVLKGIPLENKAELILSKWNITEKDNLLTIRSFDSNDTGITVGIEREAESGFVKEIGITKDPEGQFVWGFVYQVEGLFGVPMCYYGSPASGIVWRDLNTDCDFDQRINYPKRQMEINIQGNWVKANGTEKVYTDEGVFVFDIKSGKWKIVD